jgi:hypothetical protein
MNGELWACASNGAQARSAPAAARGLVVATEPVCITCMWDSEVVAVAVADPLGLAYTLCTDAQARRLAVALRFTLLALGLAGGTEAKALDDE